MYNDIFTPDPENDPQEEAELTMRLQQAVHEYSPGPDGRCIEPTVKFCSEHDRVDDHQDCGLASYSVLHYDDNPYNEGGAHWHGGGDCMCFEFDD